MTFDLKGSQKNRYTKLPKEDMYFWRQKLNQKAVLKDINFQEIQKDMRQNIVDLPQADQENIMDAIIRDSKFLSGHNIMDYSLLIVVETIKNANDLHNSEIVSNTRNKYICKDKVYHLGIIDYL